jgi:hypothetical protein
MAFFLPDVEEAILSVSGATGDVVLIFSSY